MRAKDAVLGLKFIGMACTPEDFAKQSSSSNTRRAIFLRYLNRTEVPDLEFSNLMTFFVFIGY